MLKLCTLASLIAVAKVRKNVYITKDNVKACFLKINS